jgi:hypothetical protein
MGVVLFSSQHELLFEFCYSTWKVPKDICKYIGLPKVFIGVEFRIYMFVGVSVLACIRASTFVLCDS